jgi:RimJ/RimL family protein N-acetyltransferase
MIAFINQYNRSCRLGAEIYTFNRRPLALFEQLGFKREGVLRQCVYKKGHFEDEYIYGLVREEWEGA